MTTIEQLGFTFPEDSLALGLIWLAFALGWLMVYIDHKIGRTGQEFDKASRIIGWILLMPLLVLSVKALLDRLHV